jgi:archaellum component FlaG (FlaF/FlaG flagellin family)
VPTWITTIATVGLFIGAVITAAYAVRAFGKQSQQLRDQREVNTEQTKVLRLQAEELRASLDDRQNQAAERHRAQASLIYIWEDRATRQALDTGAVNTVTVHIRNTSEQPIYDVHFSWRANGLRHHQTIHDKPLKPGEEDSDISPVTTGIDPSAFSAVAIFRDRSDWWWRAWPDGRLDDLTQHPIRSDCW